MIKELIGAKLLTFNEEGFSVLTQNGEKRNFEFDGDYGGCCGYNEFKTQLVISESELSGNPIITNIEFEDKSGCDEEHIVITFFGESKPIATVDSLSSSGSGWCYGACVWVKCVETEEKETITEW